VALRPILSDGLPFSGYQFLSYHFVVCIDDEVMNKNFWFHFFVCLGKSGATKFFPTDYLPIRIRIRTLRGNVIVRIFNFLSENFLRPIVMAVTSRAIFDTWSNRVRDVDVISPETLFCMKRQSSMHGEAIISIVSLGIRSGRNGDILDHRSSFLNTGPSPAVQNLLLSMPCWRSAMLEETPAGR
jgi:hypothetical protein